MDERRQLLAGKLLQHQAFAAGYSPLHASIYGALAGWLADPAAEKAELVDWLLATTGDRHTIEVVLLLAAGLHREVLAGQAAVAGLASYYPSVGGHQSPEDGRFEAVLFEAIMACRPSLAPFMASAHVQTNETGRGLCWLLPLLRTGWPAVHLVDLGASAGLNLVADLRAYRLLDVSGADARDADAGGEPVLADLGAASPIQFITRCRGYTAGLSLSATVSLPTILSRTGGDQSPFPLDSVEDELTLMSYVWGDQVARLARLREGIAAWHQVQDSPAPVRLYPVTLPAGLPQFLSDHVPDEPAAPVVIYNTYMTTYLPDRGSSLAENIGQWAATQARPVLWLQWEPPADEFGAPVPGWCAWTVDLWQEGNHFHWQLGWVHPHGTVAEFGAGLAAWHDQWPQDGH
jgi:hypothetical protein